VVAWARRSPAPWRAGAPRWRRPTSTPAAERDPGLDRAGGRQRAAPPRSTSAAKASVEEGVAACWQALGGIDLLVNNAGVLRFAEVVDMSLADWNFVMGINITGVFLTSRAVARRMIAQGTPASIVSTASISGKHGDPGLAHYSASKYASSASPRRSPHELAPPRHPGQCGLPRHR
jgi:NAD(P)-dependent dehydrogenase (short-subunit alcohol dehydrogenase family)